MSAEPAPADPGACLPSPHAHRKTAGTRFLSDVVRDPGVWLWGLRGGNPATAARDLVDLRAGLPLCAVAHLWNGRTYLQGLLFMNASTGAPLVWRKWRLLLPFAKPVPLPEQRENFTLRDTSPTEILAKGLSDHIVLTFDSADATWTLAVVSIDLRVVWEALTGTELPRGGAGR